MSTNNETCHLSFPLQSPPSAADCYIVRDIDVVGIGSLRRHQLLQLVKQNKSFILKTHEAQIPSNVYDVYQQELLSTLHWLRPVQILSEENFDWMEEQRSLFRRLFPKTNQILGFTAARICDQYLHELERNTWLLQDHWRYFVGFLRQKFPENKSLLEVVQWEWIHAWLEVQPLDMPKCDPQVVFLNSSFHVVNLAEDNSWLQRVRGVYGFVYSEKKTAIVEKKIDVAEALLLDLLQEDRKYTKSQLLEMVVLSSESVTQLTSQEWEKRFCFLFNNDIIGMGI